MPKPNKKSEARADGPQEPTNRSRNEFPHGRLHRRCMLRESGPGGWAWVIPGGRYRSGAARHTTNSGWNWLPPLTRVRTVEGPLEIVSDSTYVVNCFRTAGGMAGSPGLGQLEEAARGQPGPLGATDRDVPGRDRSPSAWVKGHAGTSGTTSLTGWQWKPRSTSAVWRGTVRCRSPRRCRPLRTRIPAHSTAGAGTPGNPHPSMAPSCTRTATSRRRPVGWMGWLAPGVRYRSGFEMRTTNPRMELTAALDCLRTVEGKIELVSDSTYLVNCFANRWWEKWLQQGWLNSKGKPWPTATFGSRSSRCSDQAG